MTKVRFCGECGHRLEGEYRFCPMCRAEVPASGPVPSGGVGSPAAQFEVRTVPPPLTAPGGVGHTQPAGGSPAAHGPGPADASPAPVSLKIPPWLASGWGTSFRQAGATCLTGIVAQYAVGVFVILASFVAVVTLDYPGSEALRDLLAPVAVWERFLSPAPVAPMLFTGIVWVVVSYLFAMRHLSRRGLATVPPMGSPSVEVFGAAIRFAALFAGLNFVITGIVLVAGVSLWRLGILYVTDASLSALSLLVVPLYSFALGFVVCLVHTAKASGHTVGSLLGVDMHVPDSVTSLTRAAARGAAIALALATAAGTFAGAITFHTIFTGLLTAFDANSVAIEAVITLSQVSSFFWTVIDSGLLVLGMASRFFLGFGLELDAWLIPLLLVIPAMVFAFAVGGFKAAQARNPLSGRDALSAGALTAGFYSALSVAAAVWYTSFQQVSPTDRAGFVATALLLPGLWGALFGLAGAWYYASRQSLAQIVVSGGAQSRQDPATSAPRRPTGNPGVSPRAGAPGSPTQTGVPGSAAVAACAACGHALVPGRRFCSGCGRAVEATAPLPTSTLAPASPPQSQRACTGCGRELVDGDRFCAGCGRKRPE